MNFQRIAKDIFRQGLFPYLGRFTWVSAIGLALDFCIFAVLSNTPLGIFYSNYISSIITVTTLYFLVTRFAFRVLPKVRTYALFVSWYVLAITFYSLLTTSIADSFTLPSFVAKVLVTPMSFTLNFTFNYILFKGRKSNPFSKPWGAKNVSI